jgi:hypothetical protein
LEEVSTQVESKMLVTTKMLEMQVLSSVWTALKLMTTNVDLANAVQVLETGLQRF